MRIDRQRNILVSVGLVEQGRRYAPDKIQSLYAEYIKPLWVDPSGRLITESQRGESDFPLYVYLDEEKIEAYIVPFKICFNYFYLDCKQRRFFIVASVDQAIFCCRVPWRLARSGRDWPNPARK